MSCSELCTHAASKCSSKCRNRACFNKIREGESSPFSVVALVVVVLIDLFGPLTLTRFNIELSLLASVS